jgi:sulfite reductase beta subunit-like hemoprotein
MRSADIPAAKRAGLPVDFDRLAAEGDAWLSPEDRYALKTHGVCAQLQPGVFMVRVRVPGGVLPSGQARTIARAVRADGPDWVHLTTRQDVELHWVDAVRVPAVIERLARGGLSTRSACGHTLRNVMCSEDAGLGLDEPFDCFPDARIVSDAIVARSDELNCVLPSRVNVAFGGSPRCREDARLNDAAFVSVVRDGEPGYELWAGGSLGRAPALAIPLREFVPRADVVAAAEALVDVFVAHGDFEHPAKARMKFVVARLGEAAFRREWEAAFAARWQVVTARTTPVPVELAGDVDRAAVLATAPAGGWSIGVRPQRTPGLALCTVHVPLGDCSSSELDLFADLADQHADGAIVLGRDQDVVLRNVPHANVTAIRSALRERGLSFLGEDHVARVRACTGSAVCALGITNAPETGRALFESGALGRNSNVRVHVSGCPNSCAQHQAADIGLAGGKVRVGDRTVDGYQLYVGADLARGVAGEVIGRVAAADVPSAVDLLVRAWEAMRHPAEPIGATVRRLGLDAFAAYVEAALEQRWATGPEPNDLPAALPA